MKRILTETVLWKDLVRSVIAEWSDKEPGMSACAVAERLARSPSAASRGVQRGERIVAEDRLAL